jgi:rubrerythrin
MTRNYDDAIGTLEELLAHALLIEAEAEERYRDLAAQMEAHNNLEVANLFQKLAIYEGGHAAEIEARTDDMTLPEYAAWDYSWETPESPELINTSAMHYLISPRSALDQARIAEQQAFDFFDHLARTAPNASLAEMAKIFAAEEKEHIAMIDDMLARLAPPRDNEEDDSDPPVPQA